MLPAPDSTTASPNPSFWHHPGVALAPSRALAIQLASGGQSENTSAADCKLLDSILRLSQPSLNPCLRTPPVSSLGSLLLELDDLGPAPSRRHQLEPDRCGSELPLAPTSRFSPFLPLASALDALALGLLPAISIIILNQRGCLRPPPPAWCHARPRLPTAASSTRPRTASVSSSRSLPAPLGLGRPSSPAPDRCQLPSTSYDLPSTSYDLHLQQPRLHLGLGPNPVGLGLIPLSLVRPSSSAHNRCQLLSASYGLCSGKPDSASASVLTPSASD